MQKKWHITSFWQKNDTRWKNIESRNAEMAVPLQPESKRFFIRVLISLVLVLLIILAEVTVKLFLQGERKKKIPIAKNILTIN